MVFNKKWHEDNQSIILRRRGNKCNFRVLSLTNGCLSSEWQWNKLKIQKIIKADNNRFLPQCRQVCDICILRQSRDKKIVSIWAILLTKRLQLCPRCVDIKYNIVRDIECHSLFSRWDYHEEFQTDMDIHYNGKAISVELQSNLIIIISYRWALYHGDSECQIDFASFWQIKYETVSITCRTSLGRT